MKKIRVAMLGMGNMGRTHTTELRKMEDVEIVAVCSTSDDARRYNAENGTDFPIYQDYRRMIEENDLDAIYVTLPPFAHDGQIEFAAGKKLAVFTEKPLAITLARAESIARAITDNGVKSMMGYHMRFGGAVRHVQALMAEGRTGRPTLYSANYECNSLHAPWWRKKELCGGQVFEQIIHLYDMAYYMMGDLDAVTGFVANVGHRQVPDYTIEDTSAISLRFKSGALGSITGSNCAVPNRWEGIFKIVFENCVADFRDFNHVNLTWTDGEVRREQLSFDDDVRFAENRCFIDMVRGDVPEFAPISEGLIGVRMVDAAVRSSEAGGMPITL